MNEKLSPLRIVSNAAKNWDGGYAIAGAIGNGDAFVLRDANGIRPCFYLKNDEIIAFASERVPLMTVFEADESDVKEVKPGHVFVVKCDGTCYEEPYKPAGEKKACTFERIYFSRGNDPQIYAERKALGRLLCQKLYESIGRDFKNSVFSYIPNTADGCCLERSFPERVNLVFLNTGEAYGLEIVENVPIVIPPNAYNEKYLKTKETVMGHKLGLFK